MDAHAPNGEMREIFPEQIEPFDGQPRRFFNLDEEGERPDPGSDDDALEQLAASIEQTQQRVPIIVTRNGSGEKFRLVDGERRWRAVRMINEARSDKEKLALWACVVDIPEEERFAYAVQANFGNAKLSEIEKVWIVKRLHLGRKNTPSEIAALCCRSEAWARQRIQVAKLDDALIDRMHPKHGEKQLAFSTLLEIAREPDAENRNRLAEQVEGQSTRHANALVKTMRSEPEAPQRGRAPVKRIERLASSLRRTHTNMELWKAMPLDEFGSMCEGVHWRELREIKNVARETAKCLSRIADQLEEAESRA